MGSGPNGLPKGPGAALQSPSSRSLKIRGVPASGEGPPGRPSDLSLQRTKRDTCVLSPVKGTALPINVFFLLVILSCPHTRP